MQTGRALVKHRGLVSAPGVGAVVDHVLLQSGTTIEETAPGGTGVLRAPLEDGLRVVLIRDPLAPVATIEENHLVGADEPRRRR
jgi:hypothetical protein